MRRHYRPFLGVLVLAAQLLGLAWTASADTLSLGHERSPELLPYTVIDRHGHDWGSRKIPIDDAMKAIVGQDRYVQAYNSDLNSDEPAMVGFVDAARPNEGRWTAVHAILTGLGVYRRPDGSVAVIGGCYRRDSAFAVRVRQDSARYDLQFLAAGTDRSGNGRWDVRIRALQTLDYDFDGREEAFLYVDPGRDAEPRSLICIDPESLRIEYSLDLRAPLDVQSLVCIGDSSEPVVAFLTQAEAPGGSSDDPAADTARLVSVDRYGNIIRQWSVSSKYGGAGLWSDSVSGTVYLYHTLVFGADSGAAESEDKGGWLSRLDSDMRPTRSMPVAEGVRSVWLADYDGDGAREVYVLNALGRIAVLDSSFSSVASSRETNITRYLGAVALPTEEAEAFVLAGVDGVSLYSRDLRRLAAISPGFEHIEALEAGGDYARFIVGRQNEDRIIEVRRKDWADYIRILFWQWQGYIVMVLSLLLLSLILVNSFRRRAERKLLESETTLRSVLENGQDGFYRTDAKGLIVWASPAAYRMLGYDDSSSMIGQPVTMLYRRSEDRERLLEILNAHGKAEDFEVDLRHRDGSVVTVSVNSNYFRNERGEINGVEGAFRNVTARKAAIDALKESEQKFREALQNSRDILYRLNLARGTYDYISEGVRDILGYSPAEMTAMGIEVLRGAVHPSDVERLGRQRERFVKSSVEETPSQTTEYRMKRKDGQYRWLSDSRTLVRDDNGVPSYIIGTVRDTTERRLADEALVESEAKYRAVMEQSSDCIYLVTVESRRLLEANVAMQRLLGYSSEEMRALTVYDFIAHDPDDIDDKIEQVVTGRETVFTDRQWRSKDGTKIDVEVGVNTIEFRGEVVMCVVGRDLTQRKAAEAALKRSEDEYRLLVENVDASIAVFDWDGKFLFVNDIGAAALRTTAAELLGKTQWDAFPSEIADIQMRVIREVIDTEEPLSAETETALGGRMYWYSTNVQPFRDALGRVSGAMVIAHDVTERRLAEIAKREVEERFRAVFETAQDAIFIKDRELRYTQVNPTMERVLGEPLAELKGKTAAEVFVDELTPHVVDVDRRVLAGAVVEEERTRTIRGRAITFDIVKVPMRDGAGEIVGLCGIARDVSEKKRSEVKLRRSEETARAIMTATTESMILVDRSGAILTVNDTAARRLGDSAENLIGRTAHEVVARKGDGDIADERQVVLDQVVRRGRHVRFEDRRDGHWYDHSLYPVFDASGEVVRVAIFSRDITDQKEAERRLKQTEQDRYDQVKRIAGGMAHEIYNALFPAKTCIDKLSDRLGLVEAEELERNAKLVQLSDRAVERALAMTDVVTRYSKLELEKKLESVPLAEVMREIVEANESRVREGAVQVNTDIAADISLNCYRLHAYSLFSNLFINALDALEDASRRVISVVAGSTDRGIEVVFSDTGQGINPDQISLIFNAFYSTKPTTGTGLGLAMVKKIVELYDGQITVHSEVDSGARFTILFRTMHEVSPEDGNAS